MYHWYKQAEICYGYLDDVSAASEIERSVWFTRGWTLQELLAPLHLKFFNVGWKLLGSKADLGLLSRLAQHTRIPKSALLNFETNRYTVAQKMSWASKRVTTRIEDRSYSLLGIFGVNMTLSYGEKDQAFLRLQRTIMENYDDQSILIWSGSSQQVFPFLAASPDGFEDLGGIFRQHDSSPADETSSKSNYNFMALRDTGDDGATPPMLHGMRIDYTRYFRRNNMVYDGFTLTNAGLKIKLILVPYYIDVYIAILRQCAYVVASVEPEAESENPDNFGSESSHNVEQFGLEQSRGSKFTIHQSIGIFLRRSHNDGTYSRILVDGRSWVTEDEPNHLQYAQLRDVFISRVKTQTETSNANSYGIHIMRPSRWSLRCLYHHLYEELVDDSFPRNLVNDQIRLSVDILPSTRGLLCVCR